MPFNSGWLHSHLSGLPGLVPPPNRPAAFLHGHQIPPRGGQRVAAELGLCRVGWIFTHLPREFPISSAEIRQMARFQNGHPASEGPSSWFVTLVLTQNKMGEVTPSAYMASDQGMALENCDVLAHSTDPTMYV